MVKSLAYPYFSKTSCKTVCLISSTSSPKIQQASVPRRRVLGLTRALPDNLRVAKVAGVKAREILVTWLQMPPSPPYMAIFQRERSRSAPTPKRPSSWSTCFCWSARGWSFWRRTGGVENWELRRLQRRNCTEHSGKAMEVVTATWPVFACPASQHLKCTIKAKKAHKPLCTSWISQKCARHVW